MFAQRLSSLPSVRSLLSFLLLAAMLPLLAGCGYNTIPTAEENAKAAWSEVLNQYQRRADLIPNLVSLVRGTMDYEADTLTRITEARGALVASDDPVERSRSESAVTTGVRQLLALVENYPELRANENVLRLQHQLVETEDDIAKARRYFNAVVRDHNILCQSFPTVLVARLLGFHPNGYFSVDDDERELAPASLQ